MSNDDNVVEMNKGQSAIEKAREEIADENMKRDVKKLKSKLRELELANQTVANVKREIVDLEEAIRDGNS